MGLLEEDDVPLVALKKVEEAAPLVFVPEAVDVEAEKAQGGRAPAAHCGEGRRAGGPSGLRVLCSCGRRCCCLGLIQVACLGLNQALCMTMLSWPLPMTPARFFSYFGHHHREPTNSMDIYIYIERMNLAYTRMLVARFPEHMHKDR